MTEEIIIDGVDVAKCRNLTSEWDFNNCGHICKGTECKYKRLWYKKQLKRKEQKCEEYKQILDSLEQFFKENKQTIEIAKDIVIKYCKQYFKEKIEKENFDFFHKAEEQE